MCIALQMAASARFEASLSVAMLKGMKEWLNFLATTPLTLVATFYTGNIDA